jgi:hypothetical protein
MSPERPLPVASLRNALGDQSTNRTKQKKRSRNHWPSATIDDIEAHYFHGGPWLISQSHRFCKGRGTCLIKR